MDKRRLLKVHFSVKTKLVELTISDKHELDLARIFLDERGVEELITELEKVQYTLKARWEDH